MNPAAKGSAAQRSAIVIGSDTRSFLSVVRSLGRQGVAVDVVPFDFSSAALASRYVRSVRRLPPLALGPEQWLDALMRLCQETQPDFIVPCDDRSLIPLHVYRERTAPFLVGLPGALAFDTFFDKAATRAMATQCGVPVPPGRVLSAADTAAALVQEFGLPVFVKPRSSYLLRSLQRRRGVKACRTLQALQSALEQLETPEEYLIESEFTGTGVGVSVLARRGVVSQIFQHRRVRESVAGGSTYRKSETLSASLEAMTLAICRATQLDGVAMFEFKVDDAKAATALLEVNARCWGSMPLAIAAGVDFPWLWFRQSLGEEPAARSAYRVPCYARNLLGDTYASLAHIESRQADGYGAMAGEALRWVGSFARLLTGTEHIDEFAAGDNGPGLTEIRLIGQKAAERFTRDLPGQRSKTLRRAQDRVRAVWQGAAQAQREVNVVVACYGNICRSPYAALRLKEAFRGAAVAVNVVGASLAALHSRPSPERAVQAAARAGVDLSGHQSLYGDDELIESADLVLVFDGANLALLETRGLKLRNPALRMRELLPADPAGRASDVDIADPVDGDDAMFDRTYRTIDQAVAELRRAALGAAQGAA